MPFALYFYSLFSYTETQKLTAKFNGCKKGAREHARERSGQKQVAPRLHLKSQHMTECTDVPADIGQHIKTSTDSNCSKINPFHSNHFYKFSCTYQGCHCHKFTMTEWNSRWIQAWESGISEARQVGRQKAAGGLVPILDISLNAC